MDDNYKTNPKAMETPRKMKVTMTLRALAKAQAAKTTKTTETTARRSSQRRLPR